MKATPPLNWRDRLRKAVEDSNRSKRDISLRAGLHQGFVHELLSTSKKPSIENLMAVAGALEMSVGELLGEERAA